MRPAQDPVVLGLATVVLGAGIAMEGVALVSAPARPDREVTLEATGPRGAGWGELVGTCLCAIDVGFDAGQVEANRARVLAEADRAARVQGLDEVTRRALGGLDETLLEHWDHSRILYDAGLQPAGIVALQVELDSARGLEAAGLLMGEERARRHARALFQAWDLSWLALEQTVPAGIAPRGQLPLSRFLLGP